MEQFVHFLHWHLGQGAELVEHVGYRMRLLCGPLESERKVSGPDREDSIKNWAFPQFGRYIYMAYTQTELMCSVLRYLHLCHPMLRGQTGSFRDLRQNDDDDNL